MAAKSRQGGYFVNVTFKRRKVKLSRPERKRLYPPLGGGVVGCEVRSASCIQECQAPRQRLGGFVGGTVSVGRQGGGSIPLYIVVKKGKLITRHGRFLAEHRAQSAERRARREPIIFILGLRSPSVKTWGVKDKKILI